MKPAGVLAALAAVTVLLLALGLGLVLAWAVSEGIPPGTVLVLGGDRYELDRLGPLLAAHWALTLLGLLLVALVLVIIVPLALALALGLPLLASAFGMAVVLAPVGLLLWWLWRRPTRRSGPG